MLSIPFFNVTVLEAQVRHAPRNFNNTFPLRNPRNSISPPSSWTAGRIRVSRSSFTRLTTSLSSGLNARESSDFIFGPSTRDVSLLVSIICSPDVIASVIRLKASGFKWAQLASMSLVMVIKPGPKKTDVIPSILCNRLASGDGCGAAIVDLGDKYSMEEIDEFEGIIEWLG